MNQPRCQGAYHHPPQREQVHHKGQAVWLPTRRKISNGLGGCMFPMIFLGSPIKNKEKMQP